MTPQQLLKVIAIACAQVLGVEPEEVSIRSHFELDLAAGPEERVQIFSLVQHALQVELDPEELQDVLTIQALIELLEDAE